MSARGQTVMDFHLRIGVGMLLSWVLSAQTTDWPALFTALTSTDEVISGAAREKSFSTILPRLEIETPAELDLDIQAILPAFQRTENIRLQASGLLTGLAVLRPDSAIALRSAIPVFLGQFKDRNARVRKNAVMAIGNLNPDPPQQALDPLAEVAQDPDGAVARFAIHGIARLARTYDRAAAVFVKILSSNASVETRRAAIQSMAELQLTAPLLVDQLRTIATGDNPELTKAAKEALARMRK